MFGLVKRNFLIIFIALIACKASGQQIYDISKISEEKIVIDSKLITGHENELINILLIAIDLSLDNIVNHDVTRTDVPNTPYKYKYLVVFPDLSFSIMEKEKCRLIYDPSHPDAIYAGDFKGYIRYPDINLDQEYFEIAEMVKLLRQINDHFLFGSLDPTENISTCYFTEEFLEKAIKDTALSCENIIFERSAAPFDSSKAPGLWMYHGGKLLYDSDNRFFYDSDTHLRYLDYGNYNIMLVTQEIDGIEYVRDYMILEKLHPETHMFYSDGTVSIDGKFPGFPVTVVVNHHWQGRFTEDISQAFYVNMQTRKIEQVYFDTIRLFSEI